MRKIHILFIFVIVFLTYTCKQQKLKDLAPPLRISINTSEASTDSMNLSEIATKVEYIPLQTTDSNMVNSVSDYIITGDNIFIKDGLTVLRYNTNGTFENRLFNVGRGPGEASAYLFTVDAEEKLVYVFDKNQLVIKIYDYNGKFIRTINKLINPIEVLPPWKIAFFNNNIFIALAQKPNRKYIYSCFDLESDSIRVLYKNYRQYTKDQEDQRPALIPWDYDYQLTDSTIMFKEKFCDTIFTVSKDFFIEPKFIIDLGTQKQEWEDWRDHGMFGFASGLPSGYWVQSFTETKSFLLMVIKTFKGPELFAVYNKEANTLKIHTRRDYERTSDIVYLRNDLDKLIPFPPMDQGGYFSYYGGCLFSIIEAKDFSEAYRLASDKTKNSTAYLRSMASAFSAINEFSNPVIMKVHLK